MRASIPLGFVVLLSLSAVGRASAQTADDVTREASKHFRRGVTLYAEANYAAALIEFKRALALAPNATTLYNIGETEFQLQDYASALETFQRYMAEAPPTESHRAEVEADMRTLATRVGRVRVTTVPDGADIAVDDQPAGHTPMEEPLIVSVGRRKLTATVPNRPPVTRYLDVAADDDLSVALQVPPGEAGGPAAEASAPTATPLEGTRPRRDRTGPALRTVGWIGTAVLGAGAIVSGALAISASKQLQQDRSNYPTTSDTLNHDAKLTTTYSALADSLGIAAIVLGGATLVWTVTAPSDRNPNVTTPSARLVIGPASGALRFTF